MRPLDAFKYSRIGSPDELKIKLDICLYPGLFLLLFSTCMFIYATWIEKTEVSSEMTVLDTKRCRAKNSAFSEIKKVCEKTKIKFIYDGKEYTTWTTHTYYGNRPVYKKVYFSKFRPRPTASFISITSRGPALKVIAFMSIVLGSCLLLKAHEFHKKLKLLQENQKTSS
jgi:hypothetical protein